MATRRATQLQKAIQSIKAERDHVLINMTNDSDTHTAKDKPKSSTTPNGQPETVHISAKPDTPVEQVAGSSAVASDPLTSVRLRAATILQEIDTIKDNNLAMRQQADELQFALLCISNEAASDAPMCRQLEQSVRQRRERCGELVEKCDRLERTLATCIQDRCNLMYANQTNMPDELRAITEQMKGLEHELSSARGERDNLQISLDEKKAKMEIERASVSEMQVLADARKVCNSEVRLAVVLKVVMVYGQPPLVATIDYDRVAVVSLWLVAERLGCLPSNL